MRYLLAFICPPLAILLCGRPFLALICVPLSLFYFPGALLALLVVSSHKADARNHTLMRNADKNAKAQIKAIDRQTRELSRQLREQQEARVIEAQVIQPTQVQSLPPASGSRPVPAPVQAPVPPAQATHSPTPPPKKPLVTPTDIRAAISQVRQSVLATKETAVVAYKNLPEWAQPITWGLAAATPISIVMVAMFLSRR